jgi:transposase
MGQGKRISHDKKSPVFRSPMQLMVCIGPVPREHSSGETVRRGSMTHATAPQLLDTA